MCTSAQVAEVFVLHLDVQGSQRYSLSALSHFDIRSTFMCCMFKVSFCFLGDCVVLETFKMGHGTNFAFSVTGPWNKSMELGSAAWD